MEEIVKNAIDLGKWTLSSVFALFNGPHKTDKFGVELHRQGPTLPNVNLEFDGLPKVPNSALVGRSGRLVFVPDDPELLRSVDYDLDENLICLSVADKAQEGKYWFIVYQIDTSSWSVLHATALYRKGWVPGLTAEAVLAEYKKGRAE